MSVTPDAADGAALDRLGRALGRQYRVVRLVGRGGFAAVYDVADTDLQRRLAVKVLRSDLPWTAATISRFKQEARAVARLNHPHTVPIHFVGEGEGLVYYAMPFLEGRTVTELMRSEGPLSPEHALAIVEPIVEALQHAHDHGLVHRDVKPDNILIEKATGRPMLVDFGIVKLLDGPAHLTEAGFIVGTPLYMSPEQALGSRSVDARSDLYGVGTVLYQLLTGAPPFEGGDSQEIVGRHIAEPVPTASLSRDGIPGWVSSIVLRCMAKHPDDRYPTALALLEAIRSARVAAAGAGAVDPLTLLSRADETPTRSMPLSRRKAPSAGWMLAAAAGFAIVLFGVFGRERHEEPLDVVGYTADGSTDMAAEDDAASSGPSLVIENRLTEPIAVTVQDTGLTISPGDSGRLPVAAHEALEANWAMVQPSMNGRLLGGVVEGAIVAQRVYGELRRVVDAAAAGEPRFTPTVVNRTGRPLRVTVVAGDDSLECNCRVANGDSLRLGYYRYAERNAVRVTDGAGWSARYADLAQDRDSASGAVVVLVTRDDLRPPPRSQRAPRARAVRSDGVSRNPLEAFLPIR